MVDTQPILILDELELNIRGFDAYQPSAEPSLLFKESDEWHRTHPFPWASVPEPEVIEVDEEPFDLIEDKPIDPLKWAAAGPPAWDDFDMDDDSEEEELSWDFQSLTIEEASPSCSPTQAAFFPSPKENVPSSPTTPTEHAFARFRARGSSPRKAFNSPLGSPEILNRVLV
ncbi:hypothetical protein R3P38DRAFT_3187151 [Favolaschia claudopus]|uniref:Uncharacterized protein n=1 Tax=Favolaschia claudopus TaxID=2862362 RepID=A0AAW0BYJ4_9AGAR